MSVFIVAHICASKIVEPVIRALLFEKGVDEMIEGGTPLIRAAQIGATEIVEALLDADADCNLQGTGGVSAMMAASYVGAIEVVMKLVGSKQCDVNLADLNGNKALDYASALDNQSTLYKSKDTVEFRVDKVRSPPVTPCR